MLRYDSAASALRNSLRMEPPVNSQKSPSIVQTHFIDTFFIRYSFINCGQRCQGVRLLGWQHWPRAMQRQLNKTGHKYQ